MKTTFTFLTAALCLLGLSNQAFADESTWFGDFYGEGILLGRTQDWVGFGHLRYGKKFDDSHLEIYGAIRGSLDSKSDLNNPVGQIYNDNFVFTGVGADYLLPMVPGVRLRVQVGDVFNLNQSSTSKAGFDYLAGIITYHEVDLGSHFGIENYAEGLYVYRYRNLLMDEQFRVLYKKYEMLSGAYTLGAYPILMGVVNYDTEGLDYNRFIDARLGIRFGARKATIGYSITPEYVTGKYLSGATINGSNNFSEFRLLGVVYLTF